MDTTVSTTVAWIVTGTLVFMVLMAIIYMGMLTIVEIYVCMVPRDITMGLFQDKMRVFMVLTAITFTALLDE